MAPSARSRSPGTPSPPATSPPMPLGAVGGGGGPGGGGALAPGLAPGLSAAPDPAAALVSRPTSATGGWLATGDLGFLVGEELYISGRRKEMIIIRGVNYYPEDAEALVRDAPGIHRRRCVAVTDTDDTGAEALTVIAETTLESAADRIALATRLRAAIGAALGLAEVSVRLVAPDVLPRTSSGKFRRVEARDLARAQPR
ncbi:acyl-CoA synthetase family protein [Candidatus Frankia nodulisporulans]|uniref:hypothetical protein n=1 Tax=Candidatus Frankia nodulisporulans TaxID=2060052 RepID=UPI0030B80E8A